MKHFGADVFPGKYGLKLTRENYAIINNRSSFKFGFDNMSFAYTDESRRFYTDEWCDWQRKCCLKNFDLNMMYFSSLDKTEFDNSIDRFLFTHNYFKSVDNLNETHFPGYYIMVLDEYKQLYVGTAKDIATRIRQHWNKVKSFDRLLCPIGAVTTSVLSIDAFRALDTTRLYVYRTTDIYEYEDDFINSFPSKFLCNRIGGGRLTDMHIILGAKTHDLYFDEIYEQNESIENYSPEMQDYIHRLKNIRKKECDSIVTHNKPIVSQSDIEKAANSIVCFSCVNRDITNNNKTQTSKGKLNKNFVLVGICVVLFLILLYICLSYILF